MLKFFRNVYVLVVMFVLIFCVARITPLHSDDFSYGQMGLDWISHYRHYMNWSGRVVADYISCALLSIDNHNIVAGIQALFVTIFCYLIADIPAKIFKREIITWLPMVILIGYWINNSNLGETTFWIVGAAVYFFTIFSALIFLYYYSVVCEKQNVWFWIVGFILAVIAGCSVECLAVALMFCFCCVVYLLKKQGRNVSKVGVVVCFVGLCIGMMILLLSPGSYHRLQLYSAWSAMPIWSRITDKLRIIFERFPIIYVALLECGVVAWFLMWYGDITKEIKMRNKEGLIWMLLFFVTALISIFAMVCSPTLPLRAWNVATFFLMIAFSFFFYFDYENTKKKIALQLAIATIIFVPFVQSYICVVTSYSAANQQQILRLDSIQFHKSRGEKEFSIPNYYFPILYKESDKFDTFHSPEAYGTYFGVKRIYVQDVDFDYSILLHPDKIWQSGGFKVYASDRNVIHRNGVIIVESQQEVRDKDKIMLMLKAENGRKLKYEMSRWIELSGKYYSGIALRNFKTHEYDVEVIVYR